MSQEIPVMISSNGISLFVDGRTKTIPKNTANAGGDSIPNPLFNKCLEAIREKNWDDVRTYSQMSTAIERYSDGLIRIMDDSKLYYGGGEDGSNPFEIGGVLAQRTIQLWNDGIDVSYMCRFIENVMQNPDQEIGIGSLYDFLEGAQMPINSDGCFLAYKIVRSDYKDLHTGKKDNSPGAIVEMPRDHVMRERSVTCASGLHVCSESYLPNYGGFFGSDQQHRIMVVKVRPQDVVSVPYDYNNAKMRVCRYEVLQDVTESFEDNKIHGSAFNSNFDPTPEVDGDWLPEDEMDDGDEWKVDSVDSGNMKYAVDFDIDLEKVNAIREIRTIVRDCQRPEDYTFASLARAYSQYVGSDRSLRRVATMESYVGIPPYADKDGHGFLPDSTS